MLLEALGWFGSALLVVSLLQTRVMRFRGLNAAASAVLIVYNAAIQVWPMVGLNTVLVGINLWIVAGLLRKRHDARAYDVVNVGVREPILAHLLERHAEDIALYDRDWATALESAERAFVVTSGDDVVGVVLSRAADEPATEQVVLDYVLPPYRDFTPGEFVYRSGGPFAAVGARRVVASPGMQRSEKYLAAVGFQHRDGDWVLDLPDAGPAAS